MTTIGASLVITGELTCDEDLTIAGTIRGSVSIRNGSLTVTERAVLDSNLRAPRIVIGGAVTGSVAATERIELTATAKVNGSLSANQVVLADTATFNGQIDMDRRTIAAKVAKYRESHQSV
jgi:cytoskeletal protein CcmA (bactofilin family)